MVNSLMSYTQYWKSSWYRYLLIKDMKVPLIGFSELYS